MYCENCGAPTKDDAAFCENCGAPLHTEAAAAVPAAPPAPAATAQQAAQTPAQQPAQGPAQQSARSKHAAIAIVAVVALALVAIILAIALGALGGSDEGEQGGAQESVDVEASSADDPTAEDFDDSEPAEVEVIEPVEQLTGNTPPEFMDIYASSELPGDKVSSYYGAWNAVDGDTATAWNEGVSGSGVGESITLESDEPQLVTSVSIMGGFPKILPKSGNDVYYQNARPKDITISYQGGSETFVMKDLREQFQTFVLKQPVDTTYLTITIDSVYTGKIFKDCCIAEIKVN